MSAAGQEASGGMCQLQVMPTLKNRARRSAQDADRFLPESQQLHAEPRTPVLFLLLTSLPTNPDSRSRVSQPIQGQSSVLRVRFCCLTLEAPDLASITLTDWSVKPGLQHFTPAATHTRPRDYRFQPFSNENGANRRRFCIMCDFLTLQGLIGADRRRQDSSV